MSKSSSKRGPHSKHWVITINNFDCTRDSLYNPAQMSYLILQIENGAKKNTDHYQGYVCFYKRVYLSGVKKLFPRAHLEIKKGTVHEAIHYCQKPVPHCECKHCTKAIKEKQQQNFKEYGTIPLTKEEGSSVSLKRKWEKNTKLAKAGDFHLISEPHHTMYYHAYKRMRQDNPDKPKRLTQMEHYWIYGPSGVGKSWYAREQWPDHYIKPKTKWFDGYNGQSSIIIDDLDLSHKWMGPYLKCWADIYPVPVEQKGGGLMIRPKHIIITSQFTLTEFCQKSNFKFVNVAYPAPSTIDQNLFDALNRRFTLVNLTHWKLRSPQSMSVHGVYPSLPAKKRFKKIFN